MSAPWRTSVIFRQILRYKNSVPCVNYTILPPSTLYPVRKEINRFKEELTGDHKSWKQLQEEMNPEEEEEPPVNIGVEWEEPKLSSRVMQKQFMKNRRNATLEHESRHNTYEIPVDQVLDESEKAHGLALKMNIIRHYDLYEHLFNGAYFTPVVQLRVTYDLDEEYISPVCIGNRLSPTETKSAPDVWFESDPDSLWTLVLTNLDGHLTDNEAEYVHWMIGNIQGNDLNTGEVLCDYLQPFPPKGTGYHRFVFLLFKQEKRLDFSDQKRSPDCTSLKERTFKTVDFYRDRCEDLTPMGLSFFQCDWDESVREIFHHKLNMREPSFEFDFPLPYRAVQKRYPGTEPFDRYYDRYRDVKDINEEVMRIKMDLISPFEPYKAPKFPLVHYKHRDPDKPSWLVNKEKIMHRRMEQFKDLPK